MDITFKVPEEIARRFASPSEMERRALEALALDEYRLGELSAASLRRLLGFETRFQLDAFLKAHGVGEAYSLEDLERDRADLRRAGF